MAEKGKSATGPRRRTQRPRKPSPAPPAPPTSPASPAPPAPPAPPPPASRPFGRTFLSLLLVAAAAILFMAITQLSQTIVLRGFALLGLRTDTAMIVRVTDPCGQVIETAQARAPLNRQTWNSFEVCTKPGERRSVSIVATAPSGRMVTLFVHGREAGSNRSRSALVAFDHVPLRPGKNVLIVGLDREKRNADRFEEVFNASRKTAFGFLPAMDVGMPIELKVEEEPPPGRVVGGWRTDGGARLLLQGAPDQMVRMVDGDDARVGPDGFAIVAVPALPEGMVELGPEQFRRSAAFSLELPDTIRVEAEACLPRDSTLAQWAESGTLSARDFIKRLTDVRLVSGPGRDPGARERLNYSDTPLCRLIHASMTAKGVAVSRYPGSFLAAPSDRLRLDGFGRRVNYENATPAAASGGSVTFVGPAADPRLTLSIDLDADALNAEFDTARTVSREERAAPSRFASAWSRAEAGLPAWLRALLSGIAAVAPIIILIVTISRTNGGAAPPERPNALAGLYALLMLALAVVAQPLLFHLYYRAVDALGFWEFVRESRADMEPPSTDPYAPIALAVAMMLVPLLRSAGTGIGRRASVLVPFLCVLASAAGAAALIALALLEILPWSGYQPGDSLLEALSALNPSPGDLDLIIAGAIGLGILFAWIPIYCAVSMIVPGGKLVVSSFFAGAVAVLLPVFAYLVEAFRVAFADPAGDHAFGTVSWLSLLGSTALPFLLFFLLLRAFREILMTVAPDLAEPLRRHGRRRNLLLASLLLTLPHMTLDRANPSPANMGIIDVLAMFQYFGLAVAIVAAAVLLTAYGRARAGKDKLAFFRFGRQEILLLSALFAGYLSLWVDEPLAIAVVIAAGWLVFARLVIESDPDLPPALANEGSARALIEFRQESALLASRRKTLESRFVKAEDDYRSFARQRASLARIERAREEALGVRPNEVKRRLLEFGPGPTPLANGMRGALGGLLFAVLLQLVSAIRGPELQGPLGAWVETAKIALLGRASDPAKSAAPEQSAALAEFARETPTPELLLFLGTLLGASLPWIVLGFLFGFAFHRIRGDDGFVKALVFGAGIAIAISLAQLFSVGSEGVQPLRLAPVFLFLLAVGVLFFDARSLATRGQSPLRLPEVYGFRASLGYVSLLGAMTTLGPLLKPLRDLFGK